MKHLQKNRVFLCVVLLILYTSCKQSTSRQVSDCTLNRSEKKLSYTLDSNTKTFIPTLQLYKDKDGEEYLTFQNQDQNKIIFYRFNTEELAFKMEPEVSRSNGVGLFYGYYIHNLDSIFLTNHFFQEITIVGKDKKVIEKLFYGDPEYSDDVLSFQRFDLTQND